MRRKLVGTLFAILGLMLWVGAAPATELAGTVVAVEWVMYRSRPCAEER